MKKKTINWFLVGIVCVAGFFRLWKLGQVPASPDWDEVALGYNAYSILKTGRDEYGTWFPLVLRSFDDYKPPLYAYLAILPVAAFGLDTWAVRLPSAVAGTIAVIGVYYLTKELFEKEDDTARQKLPYIATLLLALSPWHIQFSRIAFEANVGVTLNIWAVTLFLKGMKKGKFLIGSAFLFGLGLYAYHSERIFLPLLVLILALLYRREIWKTRRTAILAIVVGFITVSPLIRVMFDQNSLMRLRGTSSLTDQTGLLARSVTKLEQDKASGNVWGVLFDNRRIVWAKTLVSGYLSHYSLKWLYLAGDNPRHHAPDMGLLYLVEMPFFFWGLYRMVTGWRRSSSVVIGWFLIAPIAASPTTELPHAIRSLVFLPTFQIITAIGIVHFISWVRSARKFSGILFVTFIAIFGFNIVYYLHMYYGHMDVEYSQYWQYGYKDAVDFVAAHQSQYQKVVVSTKLEQPYMFFLYYLRYDPVNYLASGGTASGGFAEVRNRFGIYEFRPIDWANEVKDKKTLYIGLPAEIRGTTVKTIYNLDGSEAMKVSDG